MEARSIEKEFDCIAFKDKVQSEIYEETKSLTLAERKEYFRRRVETGPFADLWNRLSVPVKSDGK